MPSPIQPPSARNLVDEFSRKCHYIRKQYDCQHQVWIHSHRVVHVARCQYAPASKARCNNMASKPRIVFMSGMCGKCRPVELGVGVGVGGKLACFEMLIPRNGDDDRGEKAPGMVETIEHLESGIRVDAEADCIMSEVAVDGHEHARRPGGNHQKPSLRATAIAVATQVISSKPATMQARDKYASKHIPLPTTQTQTQTQSQPLNTQPAADDLSKGTAISKTHDDAAGTEEGDQEDSDWEALSDEDLDLTSQLDQSHPRPYGDIEDWVYLA